MDGKIAVQHLEKRGWNCRKIVPGIAGIQGSFCRSGKRNGQRCGNNWRFFCKGWLLLKFAQEWYILKKCIFLSHKTHLSAGKDLAFGRVDVIVYFNFILSEVQK